MTMDYQNELEETQRALREVTLMIEQSQGELPKITQRNAAISTHLQQVQKQGATPDELKMAYDSALDVQQRLFVMRGQLEKPCGHGLADRRFASPLLLSATIKILARGVDADRAFIAKEADVDICALFAGFKLKRVEKNFFKLVFHF